MPSIGTFRSTHKVALRKESVDRNVRNVQLNYKEVVALRKESVDRNALLVNGGDLSNVALRKESVDRNFIGPLIFSVQPRRSPQGERG